MQAETKRERWGEGVDGELQSVQGEQQNVNETTVWDWSNKLNKLRREEEVMELVLTQIHPVGWGRRQEVTRYIDCPLSWAWVFASTQKLILTLLSWLIGSAVFTNNFLLVFTERHVVPHQRRKVLSQSLADKQHHLKHGETKAVFTECKLIEYRNTHGLQKQSGFHWRWMKPTVSQQQCAALCQWWRLRSRLLPYNSTNF